MAEWIEAWDRAGRPPAMPRPYKVSEDPRLWRVKGGVAAHTGAAAWLLNRDGMRRILQKYRREDGSFHLDDATCTEYEACVVGEAFKNVGGFYEATPPLFVPATNGKKMKRHEHTPKDIIVNFRRFVSEWLAFVNGDDDGFVRRPASRHGTKKAPPSSVGEPAIADADTDTNATTTKTSTGDPHARITHSATWNVRSSRRLTPPRTRAPLARTRTAPSPTSNTVSWIRPRRILRCAGARARGTRRRRRWTRSPVDPRAPRPRLTGRRRRAEITTTRMRPRRRRRRWRRRTNDAQKPDAGNEPSLTTVTNANTIARVAGNRPRRRRRLPRRRSRLRSWTRTRFATRMDSCARVHRRRRLLPERARIEGARKRRGGARSRARHRGWIAPQVHVRVFRASVRSERRRASLARRRVETEMGIGGAAPAGAAVVGVVATIALRRARRGGDDGREEREERAPLVADDRV